MKEQAQAMSTPRSRTWFNRTLMYLMIATATLVVLGANAHLLFAAVTSQPDCVDHLKVGHGQDGAFGAADSAC